jgi:uncharacterized protein (TIGR01777 family)
MRVLITGATGFIGSALTEELKKAGHDPVPLVRGEPRAGARTWRVDGNRIDDDALDGIDAVVHLAGAPIGPWLNDEKRSEIMQSRRDGTRLIAEAVARAKPQVFISASGKDYYGDTGDTELTETSPKGSGFLADVVEVWENETRPAREAGVRTVMLRTGLVLDSSGGLMTTRLFGIPGLNLLLPFKLGVGGPFGSGRQWWSWISLEDEVRAIVHCLETTSVEGPVNLTAPEPVRFREFAKELGRVLKRPAVVPLPGFALKAIVGPHFAEEAILVSNRVLPTKLIDSGFEFSHPDLRGALESIF